MVIYLIGAVFAGWLIFLTWIVYTTRSHYNKLISRTGKNQIDEILETLISNDKKFEKVSKDIRTEIDRINQEIDLHVQKIGLVRFSPFDKRGNQESFVLSLLDKNNSGVILDFMHTPDGLRVYTKRVVNGKGSEFALTDEEEGSLK